MTLLIPIHSFRTLLLFLSCHPRLDTEVRYLDHYLLSHRPNHVYSFVLIRLGQYILSCHPRLDTELCSYSSRY